ncbi:MAG: DUF167 domain-containing protein [Pyrinomonadaceae bacterium]
MIRCTERDGALIFDVRVVPNASRSGVVGERDGALRVHVTAPPVEGAANKELIRYLARLFKVPQRNIETASGHNAKSKTLRIYGASRETLESFTNGM